MEDREEIQVSDGQGGSMVVVIYFFFNDTATTEIYTLSLHDALPIWRLFSNSALSTQRWSDYRFRGSNTPRCRNRHYFLVNLLLRTQDTHR